MKMRLLALTLLLAMLMTACSAVSTTAPDSTEDASEHTEAEIRAAWQETQQQEMGLWYDFNDESTKLAPWRDYGCFDGYQILFYAGEDCDSTEIVIAGKYFPHSSGFVIYAYRDGVFSLLEDVYADQSLTAESVWTVAYVHYAHQVEIYGDDYAEELYYGYEKPE